MTCREGSPQVAADVVGSGWQQLLSDLDDELRTLDPDAVLVSAVIDSNGLLRLRGRFSPDARKAANRLLRRYEQRATTTCELCGGTGRVYAGPVLVLRCESCCETRSA